ncbi:uncharacterized [Tachysurus ichikawai]
MRLVAPLAAPAAAVEDGENVRHREMEGRRGREGSEKAAACLPMLCAQNTGESLCWPTIATSLSLRAHNPGSDVLTGSERQLPKHLNHSLSLILENLYVNMGCVI